jgi:hypothetical protein
MLDKYLLVHQYPAGTYLFDTARLTDEIQNCPNPTPWPVNVYLADHTIEDRKQQSASTAGTAAAGRFSAAESAAEDYCFRTTVNLVAEHPSTTGRNEYCERVNRVRTGKPHQPRYELVQCNLTNQQENNPLLVFSTDILNSTVPVTTAKSTFLLDCGASRDFISQSEVVKRNLPVQPLSQKVRVILADGRTTIATQQCTVTFTVNSATFTRTCTVIQMNSAYDVILGMPFLSDVNPEINWKLKHWKTPEMIFPL